MNYITEYQAIRIHEALVKFFENDGNPISPSGVKSMALLDSALFRPQTSLGNTEKYKTNDEKAAALLCAIIQNHPFHNGNKRTALVCTLAFYDSIGCTIDAKEDDLYNFLVDIASNRINGKEKEKNEEEFFEEVVKWLRKYKYSYKTKFSDITVSKFIKQCESFGASVKIKNGSYIISNKGHSITISKSTKKLAANVVKYYFTELKLTKPYSGVNIDSLMTNGIENLSCFSKLLPILRRLALV